MFSNGESNSLCWFNCSCTSHLEFHFTDCRCANAIYWQFRPIGANKSHTFECKNTNPGFENTRNPPQVVTLTLSIWERVRSRRCNSIKNTAASIVHCFLYVTAAELPTWLPCRRFACLFTYSDNIQRASTAAMPVRSLKKGIDLFLFFSFLGGGKCQVLERRVVRGSLRNFHVGVVLPVATFSTGAAFRWTDGEGKRRLKRRVKGNPHWERASRVRVYMFGGLPREGC